MSLFYRFMGWFLDGISGAGDCGAGLADAKGCFRMSDPLTEDDFRRTIDWLRRPPTKAERWARSVGRAREELYHFSIFASHPNSVPADQLQAWRERLIRELAYAEKRYREALEAESTRGTPDPDVDKNDTSMVD